MDNNLDNQLRSIGESIPRVNPNLRHQIYQEATKSKKRNNYSFFTIPFKFAVPSLIVIFIVLLGGLSINFIKEKTGDGFDFSEPHKNHHGSMSDSFVPPLSSESITTLSIDFIQTIITNEYDIVTIAIENTLNNQTIYLTNYNDKITDVKVNNGEVKINVITNEELVFYELKVSNHSTNVHYIDIYYEKGIIDNYEQIKTVDFLILNNLNKPYRSYEFELTIDKVINLKEEGNQ